MGHAQHRQRLADAHVGRPLTRRLIVGNRSARHRGRVSGDPVERDLLLIGCDEQRRCLRPDGLEHREPRFVVRSARPLEVQFDKVQVDKFAHRFDHRRMITGDRLGNPERPEARERTERPEHRLRRVVEKVVAPHDQRRDRSLPIRDCAQSAAEEVETLGSIQLAGQRHGADLRTPRSSELDRKRKAVESAADLSDR